MNRKINILLKILIVSINLFYFSNIMSQDMWVTNVSVDFDVSLPFTAEFLGVTVEELDESYSGSGESDFNCKYIKDVLLDHKLTSLTISTESSGAFSNCEVSSGSDQFIVSSPSSRKGVRHTVVCDGGNMFYFVTLGVDVLTFTHTGYNKLTIQPTQYNSVNTGMPVTIKGITNYPRELGGLVFEVGKVNSNGAVDLWEERPLSIFDVTKETDSLTFNEIRGNHDDWKGVELRIRLRQKYGFPYISSSGSFKFFDDLEIEPPIITPDCPSTLAGEGSVKVILKNACKKEGENGNYFYPMCGTLYKVREVTVDDACATKVKASNGKYYCKEVVITQGPANKCSDLTTTESCDTEHNLPYFTISGIAITGNNSEESYLLEVYNGRFRMPALEIVTIKKNDLKGEPQTIPTKGTSGYHISSCDPSSKLDVTVKASNSFGYKKDIIETLGSGTHTISFTDNLGCTETTNVTIKAPPAFTFDKIEGSDAKCNGSKGSIVTTITGGQGPYEYTFSKDGSVYKSYTQDGNTFSNLDIGTYKVTITDATGCPKSGPNEVIITQPDPLVYKGKPNGPTCFNGTDGSISFSLGGGTRPYTITIKDNLTKSVVSNNNLKGNKTYVVSLSDFNECKAADTLITIPNPPQLTITNFVQSKPADCAASLNGEATFTILNAKGSIIFLNAVGNAVANITNVSGNSYKWTSLGIGNFQIKVKEGSCESPLYPVTIRQKNPSISLSLTPSPADCEARHTGSLNVNILNGEAGNGYYYALTDDQGSIIDTITTVNSAYSFTGLEGSKSYTVNVTDGLGCSASPLTETVSLDDKRIQLNNPSIDNARCADNPSGKITVSRVSGTGQGDITYSLIGENITGTGDNNQYTFSGLLPETYTVQALDNQTLCTAIREITILADPNPISINFSDTIHQSCDEVSNGQMRITAMSISPKNVNYGIDTIYNLSLLEKTSSSTILYSGRQAVKYNFKVVDKNKCVATGSYKIRNLKNNPILKIGSVDSLYCSNDQTGVLRFNIAQGKRTPEYKFYLNGMLNSTDSVFKNRSSKKDTILVTDADGCPGDTIMNVPIVSKTILFSPEPSFTHASCTAAKNGTITVKAVNGLPFTGDAYKYSLNTGETITAKIAVFDSLEAYKDYVVSVADSKNCLIEYEHKIPIRVISDSLNLGIPTTTDAACIEKATGRMQINRQNGTPFKKGFKYLINDSAGRTLSTQQELSDNIFFPGLLPGKYMVIVNDTNHCSVSKPFRIGFTPLFNVNSISSGRVRKFGTRGGDVRAIVSGGNQQFDYEFFKTSGFGKISLRSGSMKDTLNIRELYSGTYIIQIKDTANCVVDPVTSSVWFSDTVVVTQPESALALFVAHQNDVACYGDSTALVQLRAQGGYPDYRYSIHDTVNFRRDPLFEGLPRGTYKLYVRDNANIDTSIFVTITQPSLPLTSLLADTKQTSCYNYSDGRAILTISGGTSPYLVSLDSINWQSDSVLTGLKAYNYSTWTKDANNCFARINNILVTQPDSVMVSSNVITNTPCLKNEGAIKINGVSGGNGGYSYVWYKNDSIIGRQAILSDLYSGRYKLKIVDKDGCKGDTAFFVSDLSNVWVNFTTTSVDCWGKANGKAELNVVKGALPLTDVQWPGKPVSLYATTELDSGIHRVVIVDNLRCQKDTSFAIGTISKISVPEVWRNNPLCLGRHDGTLRVEASGGNPSYKYNWGQYGSGNEVNGLIPGIYNVSVTDANNCVRSFDFSLVYQKVEKPDLGKDLVLCSRSDYILNPGDYQQYNWTLNNKTVSTDSVLNVTQLGTYIVNVETDEQCLGTDSVNVDFTSDELLSDFLMTTQAYAGDTIMLVEISRPIPDSVKWIMPSEGRLIDYGQYYKKIALPDTGIYKYALIAHYKGCLDMVEKYIEVISPGKDISKKKSGTEEDLFKSVKVFPNPSSGYFTVEVVLNRNSDLLMKIVNLGNGVTEYVRKSDGSDVYAEGFSLNLMPGMYVLYLQSGNSSRTINVMVR